MQCSITWMRANTADTCTALPLCCCQRRVQVDTVREVVQQRWAPTDCDGVPTGADRDSRPGHSLSPGSIAAGVGRGHSSPSVVVQCAARWPIAEQDCSTTRQPPSPSVLHSIGPASHGSSASDAPSVRLQPSHRRCREASSAHRLSSLIQGRLQSRPSSAWWISCLWSLPRPSPIRPCPPPPTPHLPLMPHLLSLLHPQQLPPSPRAATAR